MKPTWRQPVGLLLLAATAAQAQFTCFTNGSTITLTGYSGSGGLITIPDFVTSIGASALYGNTNITGVIFGSNVVSIGPEAFTYCRLPNLALPNGVASIGEGAFFSCPIVGGVVIPASVTNIGSEAFAQCRGLTAFTVSSQNPAYSAVNGVLFDVSGTVLVEFPAGVTGSYAIPNGVTTIGDSAFYSGSLSSVTLSSTVTNVGPLAFVGGPLATILVDAQNLDFSSVNGVLFNKNQTVLVAGPGGLNGNYAVPSGVTVIASNAFYAHFSLTSVTLSDTVTTIESDAFWNCIGLTNVNIPAGVASIGSEAFAYCGGLTAISFDGNAPVAGPDVFTGDPATICYPAGAAGWSNSFGGLPAAPCGQVQNISFTHTNSGWTARDKDAFGSRNGGYSAVSVNVGAYTNSWTLPGASLPLTGNVLGGTNSQLIVNLAQGIGVYDSYGDQLVFIPTAAQLACLGDVNGDGIPEIVAVQMDADDNFQILVYQGNGTLLKTIQVAGTGQSDQTVTPLFVADLYGNGQTEIVSQLVSGYGVAEGGLRGWEVTSYNTGQTIWEATIGPVPNGIRWMGQTGGPLLGAGWGPDNGNEGADGTVDYANYTWSYNSPTGANYWIRNYSSGGFYDSGVVLPDLNGDGGHEIVAINSAHGYSFGDFGYGGVHILNPTNGADSAAVNLGHYLDYQNLAFGNLSGGGADQLVAAAFEGSSPVLISYGSNLTTQSTYSRASGRFIPMAVADLAGTGTQQVLTVYQGASDDARLVILDGTLTNVLWEGDLGLPNIENVVVDDLNQYGFLNVIVAGTTSNGLPEVIALTPTNYLTTGQIIVYLNPAAANGQWRFPWETSWRNSGTVADGLPAGNYPITFSTEPGYVIPPLRPPGYVTVTNGITTVVSNSYSPTTLSTNVNSTGLLTVDFGSGAPAGASWSLAGGTGPSHGSGYNLSLASGSYLVDFAPVAGYTTPASASVLIVPGAPTDLTVTYQPALALSNVPPSFVSLPAPVPPSSISQPPDGFNGQLKTDIGAGSGVAVENGVVLTAAHLVFSDQTLSYASQASWFYQEQAGNLTQAPQAPLGWFVLSGYAAQRTSDLEAGFAPGQATPASENYDVAALFFSSPVAAGSYSGYLASDASTNPWLSGNAEKTQIGYPVDGSAFGVTNLIAGQMYASSPQTNGLTVDLDGPAQDDQVYLAQWFLGYRGSDGGALFVQSNGVYYPAGIYLGTVAQGAAPLVSVVRAINTDVTNLINLAVLADGPGRDPPGGLNPLEILPGQIASNNAGYVQVQLQPAPAVAAGAAWRLKGDVNYNLSDGVESVNYTNVVTLQFAPLLGYLSPTNQTATVTPHQVSPVIAVYTWTNSGVPPPNTLTLLVNGVGKITGTKGASNGAVLVKGQRYTVTASETSANNDFFVNWTGGTNLDGLTLVSTQAALTFVYSNNLVLEANFVTNPFAGDAGTYNGLFNQPNLVTEQTAGMLSSLVVAKTGAYSGRLLLDGSGYALSGKFDLTGQASNHISRPANRGGPLGLELNLISPASAPSQLNGMVSGSNWVASLTAAPAANSLASAQYTMEIQPAPNAEQAGQPIASGYALITNYAGTARNPAAAITRISGALPDGTPFSQAVPVSQEGNVPLYASLYGGKGMLLGWINLDPYKSPGPGLVWVHPKSATVLFTNAFTSANPVALSLWTNPPPASDLAGFTNLSIINPLEYGVFETSLFQITFNSADKLAEVSGPTPLTGLLNPKTGLLTLTIGQSKESRTGYGVLLPNAAGGAAFAVTKTNVWSIRLGP